MLRFFHHSFCCYALFARAFTPALRTAAFRGARLCCAHLTQMNGGKKKK